MIRSRLGDVSGESSSWACGLPSGRSVMTCRECYQRGVRCTDHWLENGET